LDTGGESYPARFFASSGFVRERKSTLGRVGVAGWVVVKRLSSAELPLAVLFSPVALNARTLTPLAVLLSPEERKKQESTVEVK